MRTFRAIISLALFFLFILNVSGQSKIGIGVFAAPAVESIIEGQHTNNIYAQTTKMHYGLTLDINLNRWFSIVTGISSHNHGGKMSFVASMLDSSVTESNGIGSSVLKAHYLTIPVVVDINVWVKNRNKFRKIKVYKKSRKEVKPLIIALTVGAIGGYAYRQSVDSRLVDSQLEITDYSGQTQTAGFINSVQNFNKSYFGLTAGLRATFNLNENISAFIAPNYEMQLNKLSTAQNIDARALGYSVQTGLSFTVR
ncbi:MAG: hypothetical protein KJ607_14700 [Bacteroidetes bacterium]|nr:hypothetical protein [Bacteroidota bacterium]